MKITKLLTVSLLLIFTLTACSGAVSQEEYNKLLAENKELQEQLDTYKSYFSEEDNESEAEEDADEITNELTEEIYENAPTVTYEDIESGNYNEQYAKINCVVYDVVYDDENGYVYVNFYKNEEDERLLEGDHVTVYGYYHRLYTYTSTAGSKRTVPELSAIFIERN